MYRLYSFVLPAYKARFLKQAIDSILAQTYTKFELIIVNDASPENLDSIVNGYTDERIHYYKNETNLGGKDLVGQWNHCLEFAKGEYVILASDDDVYDPLYLSVMSSLVDKYPKVNVLRPRVNYIDADNRAIGVEGYLNEYMSSLEFIYAWVRTWTGSGIPFYMFKRTALIDAGGFASYPLAWFSDDSTVLRLSHNGVVASQKVLFSFRLSGESISTRYNTKDVLDKKLSATELFYEEILMLLKEYKPINSYELFVINDLNKILPDFFQKHKILGQLFGSDIWTVLSFTPRVLKMEQVKYMTYLKYFIFYVISNFKSIMS